MCGLVGYATLDGTNILSVRNRQKFMQTALYVDTLRGGHATGIAGITAPEKNLPVRVLKESVSGPVFLDMKRTESFFSDAYSFNAMIGHNRYKTSGQNINADAHPFWTNNVVLVHNGTLKGGYHSLPRHPESDVDSAYICAAISKAGADNAKSVLKELTGSYALVWYDLRNFTLNFARNEDRSLHYALLEGGKAIFWASEVWMLHAALSRTDISPENIAISPFIEHKHYSISMKVATTTMKPRATAYSPKKLYSTYSPGNYYHSSNNAGKPYTPPGSTSIVHTSRDAEYNNILRANGHPGITVGTLVEFVVSNFTPNIVKGKLSDYGTVYGDYIKTPVLRTISPGIKEEKLNKDNYSYTGKVYASFLNSKKEPVVLLKDVKVKSKVQLAINKASDNVGTTVVASSKPKTKEYVQGPAGEPIEPTSFHAYVKEGCVGCEKELTLQDAPTILWMNGTSPMCSSCVEQYQQVGVMEHQLKSFKVS